VRGLLFGMRLRASIRPTSYTKAVTGRNPASIARSTLLLKVYKITLYILASETKNSTSINVYIKYNICYKIKRSKSLVL
jgi:hypothetical protein